MDLRDMTRVVLKRLWLILLITIIASGTAAAVTKFFIPPTYEASTKLIVNKSADEEGLPDLSWEAVTVNVQLIATYKELIKTEAIMNEVLAQHPELDMTKEELIDAVNVSSVNETQVMTVVVRDDSYETAATIVNAVSEVFKAKVSEIMHVDNVTILNQAASDSAAVPVSPNLTMNVAIVFMLSFLLGVGLVFLIEHLDDSIKNEEDAWKALEIPVLSVIARMDKKDFSKQRAARAARKAGDNVYVASHQ